MTEKILGYILLFSGISAILGSTFNAYQVFSGRAKPIQYFTEKNSVFDINALIASLSPTAGIPNQKITPAAPAISTSGINDGLNLTLHLLLITIISGAGYKLASLGVLLLRTIEVKLIKNPFETIYPKPKEEKKLPSP